HHRAECARRGAERGLQVGDGPAPTELPLAAGPAGPAHRLIARERAALDGASRIPDQGDVGDSPARPVAAAELNARPAHGPVALEQAVAAGEGPRIVHDRAAQAVGA